MALIERLRTAAEKRVLYYRTLSALRNLPLKVMLDLDIYHCNARNIARRSVYGA